MGYWLISVRNELLRNQPGNGPAPVHCRRSVLFSLTALRSALLCRSFSTQGLQLVDADTPLRNFGGTRWIVSGSRRRRFANTRNRFKRTRNKMSTIIRIFVKARESQNGQTMAEYALILAAVAVVVFIGYQLMGTTITTLLTSVDGQL